MLLPLVRRPGPPAPRAQEKNAINQGVDLGLRMCLERVKRTPSIRVCFLTGEGAMFCAGGDPKGFQAAAAAQAQADAAVEAGTATPGQTNENQAGANLFAEMLADLNSLPCFVVGLANGTAMGGGYGLLCCCDTVIAKKSAMFALSEVKLGVIPATISPFVIAKCHALLSRSALLAGTIVAKT